MNEGGTRGDLSLSSWSPQLRMELAGQDTWFTKLHPMSAVFGKWLVAKGSFSLHFPEPGMRALNGKSSMDTRRERSTCKHSQCSSSCGELNSSAHMRTLACCTTKSPNDCFFLDSILSEGGLSVIGSGAFNFLTLPLDCKDFKNTSNFQEKRKTEGRMGRKREIEIVWKRWREGERETHRERWGRQGRRGGKERVRQVNEQREENNF